MVFTSPVFLGLFLPTLFAFYFLANNTARPYVLLVFSLLFYAWGEPSAVVTMVALMVVNYVLARAIAASGERRGLAKTLLAVGVTVDLGALVAYKYLGFLAENLLPVLKTVGLGCDVPKIALPIGISFYVFQIISYIVDVFRGTVAAQRNPFKFMLYVSLFPQLIAGPIVRYATIAQDIENRTANFENIVAGIRRFALGLAKKVLVADAMASMADVIFAAPVESIPCFYCWFGAVAYTIQIYFDFSGYSDMAIGLGRMFNFRFLENFDHPYGSRSIQEFWRRWHISLSTWFRDYLYIPLGGSPVRRVPPLRRVARGGVELRRLGRLPRHRARGGALRVQEGRRQDAEGAGQRLRASLRRRGLGPFPRARHGLRVVVHLQHVRRGHRRVHELQCVHRLPLAGQAPAAPDRLRGGLSGVRRRRQAHAGGGAPRLRHVVLRGRVRAGDDVCLQSLHLFPVLRR